MGVASAISGGLGLAGGLSQMISGAKEKREAEKALQNYQRQQLQNVYDNTAVSTLGADRQIENQARLASGQISALQGGGARTLIGGLGRVEAGNQNVNQQIAADLDQQQKQIDFARAGDQANIRAMQENREQNDINALSSQYMAGKQDQNTGFGNMALGAGMLGNALYPPKPDSVGQSGYTVSGSATAPNTPMTPLSMRFAPESGYVNPPILTNPAYNPQNFGPQNALRYPQFNQGGLGMFAQPRMPQVGYYNQQN